MRANMRTCDACQEEHTNSAIKEVGWVYIVFSNKTVAEIGPACFAKMTAALPMLEELAKTARQSSTEALREDMGWKYPQFAINNPNYLGAGDWHA